MQTYEAPATAPCIYRSDDLKWPYFNETHLSAFIERSLILSGGELYEDTVDYVTLTKAIFKSL